MKIHPKHLFEALFRTSLAGIVPCFVCMAALSPLAAAPLDTRGIPLNPRGLVHLDLEGAREMQMLPTLEPLLDGVLAVPAGSHKDLVAWKMQAGLGFKHGVDDLTLAVFPAHPHRAGARFAAIIRGRFSPEKICLFAQSRKFPVHSRQGHAVLTLEQGAFVFIKDERTLLLADAAPFSLPCVIAAHDNCSASFTPPAQLEEAGAHVGVPVLLAMLDGSLIPRRDLAKGTPGWPPNLPLPGRFFAALGARGGMARLRIEGTFASSKEAHEFHAYLQMLHSYWQKNSLEANPANSGEAAAREARMDAFLRRLLRKLNFVTIDKKICFDLQLSFADLAQLAEWPLQKIAVLQSAPAPVN